MIPTLSSRTQVTTILYTALLALGVGVGCGPTAEGVAEVQNPTLRQEVATLTPPHENR